MRTALGRLSVERGEALIDGLLALMLVLLVMAFGAQALAYAQARSVAEAAAEDGARRAATDGPEAGIARAAAMLDVAGGAGRGLHPSVREQGDLVTVHVDGSAPRLFPVSLLLPAVHASASLPVEQYPQAEAVP